MSSSPLSMHGVVLVLFAAMLWGTTGTAQSFAPSDMSPLWVGALRLVLAGTFFVVLSRILQLGSETGVRHSSLQWPRMLLCALCMVTYNLSFFAGLQYAGIGLGTAVALGSSPIWAGLLQALIHRRWPNQLWWIGTSIGVTGGFIMTLGNAQAMNTSLLGLSLCLLAGLSYGAYAILSQPLFMQSSVTRVNAWVFFSAGVISLPFAALFSGLPDFNAHGWAVVTYLGVVATGIAYLLFSTGLRTISAATSVALSKFEPITAFVLSIIIVGERPGWLAYIGLALVLLGLWLVVHSEMRQNRHH